AGIRRKYWRATPTERRSAVMPFLWGTVAKSGEIFGNRDLGSRADVTNGLKFSYPGYNEMAVGYPDPRVDSNEHGPNENVTVFEWLNRRPEYHGRVAAIGTWSAFKDIFNARRSGVHVDAGWDAPYPDAHNAVQRLLNRLYASTFRQWDDNAYDSFAHEVTLRYLADHQPRVLFVGYGETDEWAHDGRYDRTLNALHAVDGYIAELWSTMQADPQYRGRTTLIVTTDHGRGRTTRDWSDHGRDVEGAEEMWIAVLGPDTPPLGELRNVAPVTQSQIAASIAAVLGLDYRRDMPRAAPPLPVVK
ncbi:MAG TPA: hypothetical protein VJ867_17115, partial [Gemmatimonadaceae bacterium]|nr:hypothetical protein [Gemmatimonadaceae bacterium]